MMWTKLTIDTTVEAVDLISAFLDEKGVEGVMIEDHVPLTEEDKAAMFVDIPLVDGVDDGTAKVSCYIDDSFNIETLRADIAAELTRLEAFIPVGSKNITLSNTEDKDWMNNWKQFFHPIRLYDDIVIKHDFNNQMNAIRMLPYTYKDYDSLSDAIANYSTFLEEEFNESELLKINLPVVAGFIFSKIKEAEQKGRLISVKIKNRSLITPVPEYDLIRILGILIDNAIEATEPGHTFSLILDSKNEHIRIQTKNEGGEISSELRKKMFVRGYSTKTSAEVRTSRGQGLPNLKELVDHYNGKIYLDNETFHEHTWICFTVEL